MNAVLKSGLKRLRDNAVINRLATSSARAVIRAGVLHSESVPKYLRRIGSVTDVLPNGRTLRLWSAGDDLVPNEVFWHGWDGHEGESVKLWWELAQKSNVTFDIGAHVGLFALLAAHANPQSRVFAFDPFPAAFARLELNAKLNRLENLTCVNKAAGRTCTRAPFYYNTGIGIPGESSLRKDSTEAFMRYTSIGEVVETSVEVIRLDDFVRENQISKVDLIKLDTEGTEPEVLEGMIETLRRDRPQILCEVLAGFDTEGKIESLLRPLGYRFYFLTDQGSQEQPRIIGQMNEQWEFRNYLFSVHREQ